MFGLNGRNLVGRLAALAIVLGLISLILSYLFPSPPSTVTMATAFKGASFDYYGHLYQERFARAKVDLQLRETNGAIENLALLKDEKSGVQAAFVTGGVSDAEHAPELLSLGTIDYLTVWVFYVSSEPVEQFPQLKGKRIAVGPVGSGTRHTAEQILGKAGVNTDTASFLPLAGNRAADALTSNKVDAAFILGGPDTAAVHALLLNPSVKLMSFPKAEAYTRIFPNIVRLVLPAGAIDVEHNIPPSDIQLIATTNRVLVRSDLHPAIVNLFLETMVQVHRTPGLFQTTGEFPKPSDSDYIVATSAVDFYKSGPSILDRYLPLWLTVHAKRAIAVALTLIAVVFPLLHYFPILYKWRTRQRVLHWYRQLKALEASIDANPSSGALALKQAEIDRIETLAAQSRVPLSFSDQMYDLRVHIDIVRRRLASVTARQQVAEAAESRAGSERIRAIQSDELAR
jgi:TRAP transporter TAXI family solute receptor